MGFQPRLSPPPLGVRYKVKFLAVINLQYSIFKHYLGDSSVIETSLLDNGSNSVLDLLDPDAHELVANEDDLSDSTLLCIRNAGCEGTVRVVEKLLSMRTTEAMVGLAATLS